MKMRRGAIAGALGAVALAATPAAAQEWDVFRDILMEMIGDTLAMDGYAFAGFAHEGALAPGESEDVPLRLGPGLDFALIGECDADCFNLDLALYDADGKTVASDFMMDEFPLLEVTSSSNAMYRLRVSMAHCQVASCHYAIQSMARPQGRTV